MADSAKPGDPAEPPIPRLCFSIEGALGRFGGDRELLREMIRIFCEDSSQIMELLERGLAQRDWQAVARAAHSLRGMLSYFDVPDVVETARQIERAGQRCDLDCLPALVRRLQRQLELLTRALHPYL